MKTPLQQRIDYFKAAAQPGGTTCPCCDKHGQIYTRKFNSYMAVTLIHIYNGTMHRPAEFIKINAYLLEHHKMTSSDFWKCEWWGLIERIDKENDVKGKSGYGRLTQRGRMFAECKLVIPASAKEYNGKVMEFSQDTTDIVGALGKRFDYYELISGQLPLYG